MFKLKSHSRGLALRTGRGCPLSLPAAQLSSPQPSDLSGPGACRPNGSDPSPTPQARSQELQAGRLNPTPQSERLTPESSASAGIPLISVLRPPSPPTIPAWRPGLHQALETQLLTWSLRQPLPWPVRCEWGDGPVWG